MKKRIFLLILIIILLLSLGIRIPSAGSDWLSAYDPYFQYRHTKDVVEDGILSSWDVYGYYPPGREMNEPPLMYYLTGYLFLIFGPFLGITLMKFCGYMAAIYGALGIIPAYFLGKEFSNKKAGLLAAFFVGFSPAILTRTMGGFYDTDGLVIFFSLLVMYLLVRSFRTKKYLDYTLATIGLVLFGLTWIAAWYIPIIVLFSVFLYFLVLIIIGNPEWKDKIKSKAMLSSEKIKKAFNDIKVILIPFVVIFILASIINWALGYNALKRVIDLLIFAQDPARVLIVNISVAELQSLNVFGGAWQELFYRIGIPFIFTIPGSILLLKRDLRNGSILLTWAGISFFAITRGIRFMLVFAPAACIASAIMFAETYRLLKKGNSYSPLISFGLMASVVLSLIKPSISFVIGLILVGLIVISKSKENNYKISKPIFLATIIVVFIITFSQGAQMSLGSMAEPINKNWEDAYLWLRNNTAEDAVVGSWWDPGHRIAGIAERRNIADGAHCPDEYCDPGLNTRIVDLGKTFTTNSEEEAKDILMKYRGNSSEIYWIVSDDLIGKFRWLQYFGTGCDGTGVLTPNGNQKCPLYSQLTKQSYGYDQNYTIQSYYYAGDVSLIKQGDQWIATMKDNEGNSLFFEKEITHENGTPFTMDFSQANNTIPGTVWVHPDKNYLVYIPKNLEKTMFTRMFFYEENETLENFDLVFKNSEVKIYKLVI